MGVVSRDRGAEPPCLEQLVPVNGGQAASDLELAPCVVDLDPDDVVGELDPRSHAGPVGMREIGDSAVPLDPIGGVLEVGVLLGELVELGLVGRDAVPEHVAVACAREDAVELDARDDHEGVDGLVVRDPPVVREGQDVVAGARVVTRKMARGELAVRAVRVCMQGAAEPGTADRPRCAHRRESLVDAESASLSRNAVRPASRSGNPR